MPPRLAHRFEQEGPQLLREPRQLAPLQLPQGARGIDGFQKLVHRLVPVGARLECDCSSHYLPAFSRRSAVSVQNLRSTMKSASSFNRSARSPKPSIAARACSRKSVAKALDRVTPSTLT